MADKHWSVEIKVNGESILFISHNELSGVDNVADYADEIRSAALNLLGFIGSNEPNVMTIDGEDIAIL